MTVDAWFQISHKLLLLLLLLLVTVATCTDTFSRNSGVMNRKNESVKRSPSSYFASLAIPFPAPRPEDGYFIKLEFGSVRSILLL